jgi:hypothetical protein
MAERISSENHEFSKINFFQIKKAITFSFRPRAAKLLNKRDKIKITEAWFSEN